MKPLIETVKEPGAWPYWSIFVNGHHLWRFDEEFRAKEMARKLREALQDEPKERGTI